VVKVLPQHGREVSPTSTSRLLYIAPST